MLEVRGLDAGYGSATILFDVSLDVEQGEVVALLGRNGAGKSTTLKTIAGLAEAAPRRYPLRWPSHRSALPSYRIARRAWASCPRGDASSPDLTVAQNLEVGRRDAHAGTPWTPRRLFLLFPALAELRDRRGGEISGGEQQMLAIARTLMGNPTLLLLDEPGEGLAPLIVAQLAEALREFKRAGLSILLAEQSLVLAAPSPTAPVCSRADSSAMRGLMPNSRATRKARAEYLGLD